MPRSKNDPLKRRSAQALNHLMNAVVDLNDVYETFDNSITRMRDSAVELGVEPDKEAIERYQAYKEKLKAIMMYVMVPHNEILHFIEEAWQLDEETIKVYLG